jgi:hypothetical protein
MIPAPNGQTLIPVNRDKPSCEDQFQVGQQYSAFVSEQSEILNHDLICRTMRRGLLSPIYPFWRVGASRERASSEREGVLGAGTGTKPVGPAGEVSCAGG